MSAVFDTIGHDIFLNRQKEIPSFNFNRNAVLSLDSYLADRLLHRYSSALTTSPGQVNTMFVSCKTRRLEFSFHDVDTKKSSCHCFNGKGIHFSL